MKTQLIASLVALLAPVAAHAVDVNVDFGGSNTPSSGWNNIVVGTSPTNTPIALSDSSGNASGISLSFDTQSTALFNDNGTKTPTGAAASLPATVTRDSIFGHAEVFITGGVTHAAVPVIHFTLSGLSSDKAYQLTYFASRTGVSDVRTANYSLTNGTDTSVVVLDAANNASNTISSAFLTPSVTGTLTLTMMADATNTNSNKFFYLGSLQIQSMTASIPEPSSFAMLAGGAALGLVALRRRR
jgi:hypothetical protein